MGGGDNMRITKKKENGYIEISVVGEIKFNNWEEFVNVAKGAYEDGASTIILNWCEVTYFDSSALQGLISIFHYINNEDNKQLLLVTDKDDHLKLLKMTALEKIIPMFTSMEDALKTKTG